MTRNARGTFGSVTPALWTRARFAISVVLLGLSGGCHGGSGSDGAPSGPMRPDLGSDAVVCGAPGDRGVTTEEFAALEGCDVYEGSVFLGLGGDYSVLSLRIVWGNLIATGDDVEILTGFDTLEWVGSVQFSDCRFRDVATFGKLSGVDRQFELVAMGKLGSLQGLEQLGTVGGGLRIESIPGLTTLDGLGGLETVGGDLDIWNNENLTSLAGLSALQKVGGNVTIHQNAKLTGAEVDAFVARVEIGGVVNRD